jgi:hypothetical protein
MRVFQKVLEIYEKEKMTGGYADSITLCWFDDGLNGNNNNECYCIKFFHFLLLLVVKLIY